MFVNPAFFILQDLETLRPCEFAHIQFAFMPLIWVVFAALQLFSSSSNSSSHMLVNGSISDVNLSIFSFRMRLLLEKEDMSYREIVISSSSLIGATSFPRCLVRKDDTFYFYFSQGLCLQMNNAIFVDFLRFLANWNWKRLLCIQLVCFHQVWMGVF